MDNPKLRLAHLSGPASTIENTPPLVTSDKARRKQGLPPREHPGGDRPRFDVLRPQRLARPVTVYVEQFSAHPLEADAARLYGPPDGYVGADGAFSPTRRSEGDKPVYAVELAPEDGLYPLPYAATRADGTAWEDEVAVPGGAEDLSRQGFFPDGSRLFEEIDRLSIGPDGTGGAISAHADVDHYRVVPSGGYTQGLAAELRSDAGEGPVPRERRGEHFFAYRPFHLARFPARPSLARIANETQRIAGKGTYDGLIWTLGSPQIEEVAYWLNLTVDSDLPICCNAAHRSQGQASADGPQNILDSIAFIRSGKWSGPDRRNRCGVVVIQDQQIFAAREVAKVDARPGGFAATGGHGGIIGQVGHGGRVFVTYLPAYRFTSSSELCITRLPDAVFAAATVDGRVEKLRVAVKDAEGYLLESAIPSVSIIKIGSFDDEDIDTVVDDIEEMKFQIARKLSPGRLAGFVLEGLAPYGRLGSTAREQLAVQAAFQGIPCVRVGRGAPEGFADCHPFLVSGANLTATKARMLLMACLMKLGSLPVAADPRNPTAAERTATSDAVREYQKLFDTH